MMSVESYFLDSYKLAAILPGYNPRETQIKAASLINNAMAVYENIAIEAPTGSGKTMAYLIPTYLQGKRTIISTKTKQLMQQLYLKDIPIMQKLFGERVVRTIKGRKNYFCPHRFMKWIYPNKIFYKDIIDWFGMQEDEIIEVPKGIFDSSVTDRMTADSSQCIYGKCKYFASCPFIKAKDNANKAEIVITNHHLLLTDIAMKAKDEYGTIFEQADHLIFDEAHSIADIYANFTGKEISTRRLVSTIEDFKEHLSTASIVKLKTLQQSICESSKDSKSHYSEVQEKIHPFMELCSEMIDIIGDDDLKNEFSHIEDTYRILNEQDGGLRIAEKRGKDLLLKYIPIETGQDFLDGLHSSTLSSVFISATLTANNGSFEYFLRETGLNEANISTVSLPSVFELKKQGMLLVPQGDPDENILEICQKLKGSALVICNSIKRMEYLNNYLSAEQNEKAVFTQDDGDWSTFTSMGDIILIGCATLREGLDLAGGDFSCVVIDKLPFEYPNDIFLEKKASLVKQETGDSFNNFYLPRAVLYFKQAVGRLIRHESDIGIWVCTDDRIITKSYGKYFRNVLDNVSITKSVKAALEFILKNKA